ALLATWQGELNAARLSAETCLELARQLEDPALIEGALLTMGVVHLNMGNYAASAPFFKEALELFQDESNVLFPTIVRVNCGNVALGMGNPTEARAWLEQAYADSRDLGEDWINSFILEHLGEVARVEGDYAAARHYYEESESLLRTMRDEN